MHGQACKCFCVLKIHNEKWGMFAAANAAKSHQQCLGTIYYWSGWVALLKCAS